MVDKSFYETLFRPFLGHPGRIQALKTANRLLTGITYLAYPLLLLFLLWKKDPRFWPVLLVPGISFVVVSLFRRICCFPRPYEVLNIRPLIPKNTRGKSFPSRHVFSIFIIAMAFGYVWPWTGWVFALAGVVLALIRVVSGVHFPRDVLAGALIALLLGAVGFYLVW